MVSKSYSNSYLNTFLCNFVKKSDKIWDPQRVRYPINYWQHFLQDAQLSQRDRAAGCVIVFAKSRTLELGDNNLRTL